MNATSRFARAGDIRMHYWDWGGDGRPLVLAHATGFHGAIWAPIAEALLPEFRPIAYDWRGHGDTDTPADGYGWDHAADNLAALLGELGLSDAVGVGHSAGAAAVAICAVNHPGSITQCVLIDPTIFPPRLHQGDNFLATGARRRRAHWDSREQAAANYRSKQPFDTWHEEVFRLYLEHGLRANGNGGFDLSCPPWAEAITYEGSGESSAFALLPQLPGRTLLLYGEHSTSMIDASAKQIVERLPSAVAEAVPDTGHLLTMERPDAVAARLRRFLLDEA